MDENERSMVRIEIDKEKCILCRKCEKVCPAGLFSLKDGRMEAEPDGCIACGHCAAICPEEAIRHSDFQEGKIHEFDRSALPSPDSLELLIRSRRSNRAFSGKPVPDGFMERIIDAARRAPTASNLQQVRMVTVTDPEILHAISRCTVDKFYSMARLLENPFLKPALKLFMPDNYHFVPRFIEMKEQLESGHDPILKGAAAAVFFVTPDSCRFGCQDSNLAYQNASLMAEALGVAHFYTGFVCTAASMDRKRRLQKLLQTDGTVHAGMALGMPLFRFGRYIDRKESVIKTL